MDIFFDEIFQYIGGFGLYQFTMFILMCLGAMSCNEIINMNFGGYPMEHWCFVEELKNFTFEMQKKIGIPAVDGVYDSCHVYNYNYSLFGQDDFMSWNRSTKLEEYNPEIIQCSSWVYEKSVMHDNLVSQYNLVCDRKWIVQIISTTYMFGFLLGAVPCGIISDIIGRRLAVMGFLVLKIAASFLTTYAPHLSLVFLGRFLLGIGTMGVFTIFFVLIVEIVGPNRRTLVGVGFSMALHFGYMVTSLEAIALRHFRDLQLLMGAPYLVLLLLYWMIPESPRWLLLQGRKDEADETIRYIAEINHRTLPSDYSIYGIKVLQQEKQGSLFDIFKTGFLRKRTLILYYQWFTIDLLFYSLNLNTASLPGSVFFNTFMMSAVGLPACILGLFFMNWKKMGRRLTSSSSLIFAGIACFSCVPVILTNGYPSFVTGLSMLGKASITISMACAYIFTSELYPTAVRNVAVGSASMFARLSAMAAPYMGAPLAEVWPALPNLIFGVLSISAGILTLLLPETFGKRLQETITEAELRSRGLSMVTVLNPRKARRGKQMNNDKAPTIEAEEKAPGFQESLANGIPPSQGHDNIAFDTHM